jgi:hypothetical protein
MKELKAGTTNVSPQKHSTYIDWKSTDVSEEHVSSIVKVEEWARQETSMKQLASRAWEWRRHFLPKRRLTRRCIPQYITFYFKFQFVLILFCPFIRSCSVGVWKRLRSILTDSSCPGDVSGRWLDKEWYGRPWRGSEKKTRWDVPQNIWLSWRPHSVHKNVTRIFKLQNSQIFVL